MFNVCYFVRFAAYLCWESAVAMVHLRNFKALSGLLRQFYNIVLTNDEINYWKKNASGIEQDFDLPTLPAGHSSTEKWPPFDHH